MSEQAPAEDAPVDDLDADADEAEQVKGGARVQGDPCDGGE